LAQQLPEVECVCEADSEADIYELFAEPRGEKPVHWLIRACQDRALESDSPGLLREQVLATPVLYTVDLMIRGRTPKLATEKRSRHQNRETRQAKVEVRAAKVTLRPPWRADRELPAITVNVVLVREPNPPSGEQPIEWILVTTLAIDTPEQVRIIVEYYCVRWHIEVLFRTLKTGCRIEERRFERLGGHKSISVDFRLISATNRPLEQFVRDTRFREDLYYRVNAFAIRLPSLRERQVDIPVLAQRFLARYCAAQGLPLDSKSFSKEAIEALCAYQWPGNIRELESTVSRAALSAPGRSIRPSDIEFLHASTPTTTTARSTRTTARGTSRRRR
jgi:hypothetical protein